MLFQSLAGFPDHNRIGVMGDERDPPAWFQNAHCFVRTGRGVAVLESVLRSHEVGALAFQSRAFVGRCATKPDAFEPLPRRLGVLQVLLGPNSGPVQRIDTELPVVRGGIFRRQQCHGAVSRGEIDDPGAFEQRRELALPEIANLAVVVRIAAAFEGGYAAVAPELLPLVVGEKPARHVTRR